MRFKPLACRSTACWASSTPLVVSAISSIRGMPVRSPTKSARFARSSGSPPVRRSLRTPRLGEQARQAHDLVERQPLLRLQEPVVLVKLLLRHAIGAAEIAAVHHGNAQIMQRPPAPIERIIRAAEYRERWMLAWMLRSPAIHAGDEALWRRYWVPAAARRSRRCRPRLRKSPEPLGGRGMAQGRPQSSCSMATGRK